MTGRLQGRVALITGAARGQGRAHAVRLAGEGADVIAVDLCGPVDGVDYPAPASDDLLETADLVRAAGGRVHTAEADVRDLEALEDAVARGVAELGRLDVVCANAGILMSGVSHRMSPQRWQTVIDVNLTGVWHTTRVATPYLVDQGQGGSMILTSSVMGLRGAGGVSAYTVAKFGVRGLAQSLAHELAPHRIRVNSIHPTNVRSVMIDNPATRRIFRPDLEAPTTEDVLGPLRSLHVLDEPWIEPEDVSAVVLWLASDDSRYVTGTAVPIDLGAGIR